MATITRFAPVTRSIAPPMPGTSFPGIIQLARRPLPSTWSAPSTVMSTCPPRISPKDVALSKVHAPGSAPTGFPPASVSRGWCMPSAGGAPVPISPFSDWKYTCNPGGTNFETSVGMPMPRLTSMPSLSSCAIRLAMIVWASMGSRVGDDVVDDGCGGDDVVRSDHADGHDVLGFDDHLVGRHGDDRVEIAGGQRVVEVADVVREE